MLKPVLFAFALAVLPLAAAATPRLPAPPGPPDLLPGLMPAYCYGQGEGEGEGEGECDDDFGAAPASRARTDQVVDALADITQRCSYFNEIWRVDCLRDGLNHIAQTLPVGGEYDAMRIEIAQTVARLETIVDTYADPAQPPVRRRAEVEGLRRAATGPIRPIAPANLPAANAAAIAAVEELSTTLLRSAATNASTAVHYERAAEAVTGTLILLRSS